MDKQSISMLFEYNAWSTARILDAASALTAGQFTAPVAFPHGSLRGTLVHTLYAEWLWRNRWQGNPSASAMRPEDFPSLKSLRSRWAEEQMAQMQFVADLTEDRLGGSLHYVSTEGFPHDRILWETMLHMVNHGTQHKTEAAAILTSLGSSPGDIDLIVYLNRGV